MALIVEDGSIVAGAESYISVADATTYHTNRGNSAWDNVASDTEREQLLRKATEFMVETYRSRWSGSRVNTVQALDWPRYFVPIPDITGANYGCPAYVANNVVPIEVQRACAELALRAIAGDLAPDLSQQKISVTVGPISTTYDKFSSQATRYTAVDRLLAIYLRTSGVNTPLVRS